jgi:hypothetical protein
MLTIISLFCLTSSLFVPKNEIYPMVQRTGHVIRFQGISKLFHEVLWPYGSKKKYFYMSYIDMHKLV